MNHPPDDQTSALRSAAEHTLTSPGPVRGRDVQIDKLYRARCHRPGCGWTGAEHAAYQDASAERQAHLSQHLLAAQDVP